MVVALEGFVNDMNWGKKTNAIPLSYYFLLVLMFLSVNVLNNYALNFHIPLPLHMIFRSGSLIANLVLGKLRCSWVCCVVVGFSQWFSSSYMAKYELILSLFSPTCTKDTSFKEMLFHE